METTTTKFSLIDGVPPISLEENLLCKKCKFSTIEGRGATFAGYHEYYALVCDKMENNSHGYKEELNGADCFSAPVEGYPNGYMELITACSEFELKPPPPAPEGS